MQHTCVECTIKIYYRRSNKPRPVDAINAYINSLYLIHIHSFFFFLSTCFRLVRAVSSTLIKMRKHTRIHVHTLTEDRANQFIHLLWQRSVHVELYTADRKPSACDFDLAIWPYGCFRCLLAFRLSKLKYYTMLVTFTAMHAHTRAHSMFGFFDLPAYMQSLIRQRPAAPRSTIDGCPILDPTEQVVSIWLIRTMQPNVYGGFVRFSQICWETWRILFYDPSSIPLWYGWNLMTEIYDRLHENLCILCSFILSIPLSTTLGSSSKSIERWLSPLLLL